MFESNFTLANISHELADDRILEWARCFGKCVTRSSFAQSLNGQQVSAKLDSIFRETPTFGRSLASRLSDFHDPNSKGSLNLIDGGGEAVVFFDEETQDVVKLFSLAGKAQFGWQVETRVDTGNWDILPGTLKNAILRFALAENTFPTGLEIEGIGEAGEFLLLRQPFIEGKNPRLGELDHWMFKRGWEPYQPKTRRSVLKKLTWRKNQLFATDVRPENAICSKEDGKLYSIDFIMSNHPMPTTTERLWN